MSMIIYVLIIIIIIAIIIVWYISCNIKEKADNAELELNTDEDKILQQWFEDNKKLSFNIDLTNEEIVVKLIKRIYDFDIDYRNIVIGTNLEQEYYNITGNKILKKFSEKVDCILYLRSIIGINYEVCIINSSNSLLNKLSSKASNDLNLNFLNDIIESNLEKTAYDHVRKVLNIRWGKILETNNNNILERSSDDSFLYLKPKHDIPNLITDRTIKGDKVNLLCNNIEFEGLIHRLNCTPQNQKLN